MSNKINSASNLQPQFKHGFYHLQRVGAHPCRHCVAKKTCAYYESEGNCKILQQNAEAILSVLAEQNYLLDPDFLLINQLIEVANGLLLITIYYAQTGRLLTKKIDEENFQISAHAVAKYESILRNQFLRICDQLGLSPLARKSLQLATTPRDIASRAAELRREKENAN